MSNLEQCVVKRKKINQDISTNFNVGYQAFKVGSLLKEARKNTRTAQEELVVPLQTKKLAISRIENPVEGVKLFNLEKFAASLGEILKFEYTNV